MCVCVYECACGGGLGERVRISYDLESELIEKVLWYGSDIELVEPLHLREQIIARLREVSDE